SAPAGVDPDEVGAALAGVAGVVDVHDLHVWSIATNFPALAAHVVVADGCDARAVRRDLEEVLRDRFGIGHTTLQVEVRPPRLLRPG
ncbi:MAG TPA: hypothetical protein VNT51_11565, partial [Miltoncostaeaceae bacterium]|nr:hypothetical protein [Miltoncostaeaceae bacterium]